MEYNEKIKSPVVTRISRFYITNTGNGKFEARFKHSQSNIKETQVFPLSDDQTNVGSLAAMLKRFSKNCSCSLNFERIQIKQLIGYIDQEASKISIKRKEYDDGQRSWSFKFTEDSTSREEGSLDHETEVFFDKDEKEQPNLVLKTFIKEMNY